MEEINTLENLFQAIESSKSKPLLIFKHSLTCPISSRAFNEVKTFVETDSSDIRKVMVVVQEAREVSNKAASLLEVQHESPQIILVKDGKAIWNTSHFQITANNLKSSVESIEK